MSVEDGYRWLLSEADDAFLLHSVQTVVGSHEPQADAVGVAVSGGSDSMALLHLAARVARQVGWSLRAVTVDHRLRPEAVEEAAHVARVCNDLGVPHDVVVWEHGDISGNLMEAARLARYHLMSEWGKTHGVGSVLLGHTADDEAETFLMALSRAAGLEGLSGMRRSFVEGSVTFRRPLLHEPRAALRAYLVRHGLTWVDDPTNENDRYTRTKARRALKALKPLGISVERLSSVVHNLHMAQGVVAEAVRKAGQEVVTETAGSLVFDRKEFLLLGPEINRLLLHAMLGWMTGQRHPPRSDQVRNLHFAVVKERDATLAGCRFLHRDGRVIMTREARAVGGPVPVGEVWDGRWQVSGPAGEVRALGADGLRQRPDWRSVGLPREALAATPAVWQGETLVSAPLAGWENGWSARLDAPVRFFGLSD